MSFGTSPMNIKKVDFFLFEVHIFCFVCIAKFWISELLFLTMFNVYIDVCVYACLYASWNSLCLPSPHKTYVKCVLWIFLGDPIKQNKYPKQFGRALCAHITVTNIYCIPCRVKRERKFSNFCFSKSHFLEGKIDFLKTKSKYFFDRFAHKIPPQWSRGDPALLILAKI